ncbi:MAG: tRNA pseudouridine(38-40) synthase TruA, partial [Chitinophagaceae bacterium]|nr:tRNA pseudouridine(38-40) synthase TruA [Chitinophagaceae bacterium]
MPRYFLEVSYKGTLYSGFQTQHNANTIQAEIEKAINTLLRLSEKESISLTGSSRTDAGVHALQNYFHFDSIIPVEDWVGIKNRSQFLYKMNAILPADIVVKHLLPVGKEAHCRFDAISRQYCYYIYHHKDPFLKEKAYYFPYKLDIEAMQAAASLIKRYTDFTSFSKRNTQVKSFICQVIESQWEITNEGLIYQVKANRFLRGMVRALTATMLKVGRQTISLDDFKAIIEERDCTGASFAVPPHGLFLMNVQYPDN